MKYSRRDILRAAALGGGLIAGEMWIPGAKTIFIPDRHSPVTGNLLLTMEEIQREALLLLKKHVCQYLYKTV